MNDLEMLTFDILGDEIDAKLSRARDDKSRAGWVKLREVASGLEGTPAQATDFDPTQTSTTWFLTKITVAGVLGIPHAGLHFEVPPHPGLTVVHGGNGAGKSSLVGAIDMGLHQNHDATLARRPGAGGNAPVWQSVPLHAGADIGNILLELRSSDGARLTIPSTVTQGAVSPGEVVVESRAGVRRVVLGSWWRSALKAYSPIYSYHAWSQYIQRAQDMREYLSRMLVLGNCFTALCDSVRDASSSSLGADSEVRRIRSQCEADVRAVEKEYSRHFEGCFPELDEDVVAWWEGQGFPDPSDLSVMSKGLDFEINLSEPVEKFRTDLHAVSSLSRSTAPRLLGVLRELSKISEPEAPSESCPVCARSVDWRSLLGKNLEAARELSEAIDSLNASRSELYRRIIEDLTPLVEHGERGKYETLERVLDLCNELSEQRSLRDPPEDVEARVLLLLDAGEFRQELNSAIELASVEASWTQAIATAVLPFRQISRGVREAASQLGAWEAAKRNLVKLESDLIKKRQDGLMEQSNEMLRELLADVGIVVGNLKIQKTKAEMGLKDSHGRPLAPGMLSAGQQNALLLAPALAFAGASPFGFLIVDDPVHAFDELRVDYLARRLAEISRHRRLIVFTHDERLKEHLMAAVDDVETWICERDHESNGVSLVRTDSMWQILLRDAEQLLNLDRSEAVVKSLTNTLRGLCRQSFENCLRIYVMRQATIEDGVTREWLAKLEEPGVGTTKQRIERVRGLVEESAREKLNRAVERVEDRLDGWNRASHGNQLLPGDSFSQVEIDATRAACEELFR